MPLHAVILAALLGADQPPDQPRGGAMTDVQRLALEASLQELQERTRASAEVRKKVVAGLPETAPVLLYRVTDRRYDEEHLRQLIDLVRRAVIASGLYPKGKPPALRPRVSVLGKSRVVLIEVEGPPVAVSGTEEKGPLRVSVWVCPDRATALDLFWLRRGGSVPAAGDGPDSLRLDSRSAVLPEKEAPGEMAYQHLPQEGISVALKKSDPRTQGNRVGFLRHNVIVELHRLTYSRAKTDPDWLTTGLTADDIKDLLALGAALDKRLKGVAGTAKEK
jgi:hypothetical protein